MLVPTTLEASALVYTESPHLMLCIAPQDLVRLLQMMVQLMSEP